MISAKQLRELVRYDPVTGIFTWNALRKHCTPGKQCGRLRQGYIVIGIDYKEYLAHRLAWLYVYGEWPKDMIDHIDGDRGNNRIANLRESNNSQNGCNRGKPRNNTVGYKGVTKQPWGYQAQIKSRGKYQYLGMFRTAEEAHAAYVKAAAEQHGEFFRKE